ncbi:TadE family type IV pilus minor pilin [Motilibacter aurantiacus]|uniref:TadE family type IV pilus minor pilin n=1 Tax=Motilibacter aurantiacus TaxID=2714955 RepID=UPI002F2B245B
MTAEAALALPALCLVLGAALFVLVVGMAKLQCADAARAGARVAARGEPKGSIEAAARSVAPSGARVGVETSAGTVRVTVDVAVGPPGVLRRLGSVRLSVDAVAAVEEPGPAIPAAPS